VNLVSCLKSSGPSESEPVQKACHTETNYVTRLVWLPSRAAAGTMPALALDAVWLAMRRIRLTFVTVMRNVQVPQQIPMQQQVCP